MAIFSVHAQDGTQVPPADVRFLRENFSWRAFWLGPFWLLWHRLYSGLGLWTLGFLGLCLAAASVLSPDATVTIFLLLQALLGLEAEHLLERKWARQNYRLVDIVAAPALEAAEITFYRNLDAFDASPGAAERPSPPTPRPPAQNVLGSFPQPEARR